MNRINSYRLNKIIYDVFDDFKFRPTETSLTQTHGCTFKYYNIEIEYKRKEHTIYLRKISGDGGYMMLSASIYIENCSEDLIKDIIRAFINNTEDK